MSGIYIKGRKPPVSCDDCWVSDCPNDEHIDGYRMMDRPTYCPLVPVPDHGRLIDADALVQVLKFVLANPVGFDGGKADVFAVGRTIQLLEEAQTIIEADKEGE